MLVVAVLKETRPGEKRVALDPQNAQLLLREAGPRLELLVEENAGELSGFSNGDFERAGAKVAGDRSELIARSDVTLRVKRPARPIEAAETPARRANSVDIGFLDPQVADRGHLPEMARAGITGLSFELIPGTPANTPYNATAAMSRVTADVILDEYCQSLGIKNLEGRRVLVLGIGNAGLEAAEYASKLKASVLAISTSNRCETALRDHGVSLEVLPDERAGDHSQQANTLSAHRERIAQLLRESPGFDLVICSARRVGSSAPRLISKDTIASLTTATVFYDLTASSGGNCEGNHYGETVQIGLCEIRSRTGYPAARPAEASAAYAGTLTNMFGELVMPDGSTSGRALEAATSMGATTAGSLNPTLAQPGLDLLGVTTPDINAFFRSVRGSIERTLSKSRN